MFVDDDRFHPFMRFEGAAPHHFHFMKNDKYEEFVDLFDANYGRRTKKMAFSHEDIHRLWDRIRHFSTLKELELIHLDFPEIPSHL